MKYTGIIDRYREFLSVSDKTPIVTLNEGATPLIYSYTLSERLGLDVYLKYEGPNPVQKVKRFKESKGKVRFLTEEEESA